MSDSEATSRLTFHYTSWKTSKSLHDLFTRHYHIDIRSKFGLFCLRLIDFLIRLARRDETGEYLLIPIVVLAALAGERNTNNFRANKYLNRFTREVFPLQLRTWNYGNRRCRMVAPPRFPEVIQHAIDRELEGALKGFRQDVHFDTGLPVTRKTRKAERLGYGEYLTGMAQDGIRAGHPAYDLIQFLNGQSPRVIDMLFKANLQELKEEALALPNSSDRERNKRRSALALINHLMQFRSMKYREVDKTDRIYTIGLTFHQLPRQLRQIAYKGCITIDLRCAQLAIASTVWGIPDLHSALSASNRKGGTFWTDLISSMKIETRGDIKRVIKKAVYATCFGMVKANVSIKVFVSELGQLGYSVKHAKLVADAFIRTPLIESLFQARDTMLKRIRENGGAEDAFGAWIPLSRDTSTRSILARVMQSHELRIMLAGLPILKSEANLHVVSWLHDGLTIKCSDQGEAQRQTRRLCRALQAAIDRDGIPTVVSEELVEDTIPGDLREQASIGLMNSTSRVSIVMLDLLTDGGIRRWTWAVQAHRPNLPILDGLEEGRVI